MDSKSPHKIASISSHALGIVLVVLLLTGGAGAQTEGSTRTDSSTPVGLSPGSPTGSYPLSGFDTVNLFNGGLNFSLPLLKIGGRGGTSYSLPIHIEQKWSISRQVNPHQSASYTGHSGWWSEDLGTAGTLNVGRLQVRRGGSENFVTACGEGRYTNTLTRITFTAPDGTEYELRDQLTGGQPATTIGCQTTPFNRQKVFVTADGTSATFISDSDIVDALYFNEAGEDPQRRSGEMMLRDGTHFHIVDGNVRWMRDRNGNKVTFDYDPWERLVGITDSLNRHVTISYANATTFYDEIRFSGYGGTQRTIKIGHCLRSNAMRGDISMPSQLFPGVTAVNSNPPVINYIELPNGRRYQIEYNAYAEIARVELPTGGAIEYDWANGLTDGDASGIFNSNPLRDKYVYRRIVERRLYPDGASGSAYESKLTYSRPESTTTNDGYVVTDLYDSVGALLGRSRHYFYGSARASFLQKGTDYPAWQDTREYKTEILDTDGATLLRRVENTFEQRGPVSWWIAGSTTEPPNDVRPRETITTLADTNQVTKQSFGYDDSVPFNNQNSVKEYDYGVGAPGNLLRETRTTYLKDSSYVGTSVHIRNLPLKVEIYDGSNQRQAQTGFEYDNYTLDGSDCRHSFHCPLVARSNISGFDSSLGVNYATRGNVTAVTRYVISNGVVPNCLSTPSLCITNYAQFDIAGNVLRSIDPRSTPGNIIAATVDYDDRFGIPDGEARSNVAPSELGGLMTFAFPTKATNALGHTAYSQYDYYLGAAVNAEDANGIVASGSYDDLLDRPKQVKRAVGTSAENRSTFDYDDIGRVITTTGDLDTDGRQLIGKLLYDQMGRTIETQQFEGLGNYIAVQTRYDAQGRAYMTSNPFRPWKGESALWTTSEFDALGRVKKVRTPDGALVSTDYPGNSVTVTDQALRTRKIVTDGLGRVTSVYEFPSDPNYNYLTTYAYDALDNLTLVTQGSQTRTFVYDSLKRLKSATNPENGTVCYGTISAGQCQANGYDANGNLLYKTDARGVRITYTYDALNRNTQVDYSDTTLNPDVTYAYDNSAGGANGIGRLWYSYAGGTNTTGANVEQTAIDNYDPMGRPKIQRQLFKTNGSWSSAYQTQRTYDLAGHVKTQSYPSGHTVTYNYDAAGRLGDKDASLAFSGNLGEGGAPRSYASEITYSSFGGMTKEKFGTDTSIYNKLFYNSRGQLGEIRAGTVDTTANTSWNRGRFVNWYSLQCGGAACNATDNNGNLRKQETWIPNNEQNTNSTNWYQQYEYDPLNRLTKVEEYASSSLLWRQSFGYDRYGNRTIVAGATSDGINKLGFEVEPTTNRLLAPGDSALTGANLPQRKARYDAAGNLINDNWSSYGSSFPGATTRTFDAENRMISAQDSSGGFSYYTYNADGNRVRRKTGTTETWQIYGMDGELLAEYPANTPYATPHKEYGYRNGQLLITAEAPIRTNVALSSNGATAVASSTNGTNSAANVINGDRKGSGGAIWMDNTFGYGTADSIEIAFNSSKTINQIDVVTRQDDVNNPVEPTLNQTFSLYGITNFEVQCWNGTTWTTVPGGNVTGNNKVWRQFTFPSITTSKIRVVVSGGADNAFSRVVEVEAYALSQSTNVALPANGGAATASSYFSDSYWGTFPPANAVNGDRKGSGGVIWMDNTSGAGATDTIEIAFNSSRTINEIDVVTRQDDLNNPVEPTLTQAFGLYGITAFEVQYWNGAGWVTVPNGSVSDNNKVWRQFVFPAVTTNKIRVVVNAGADNVFSRVVEVEAWTDTSPTANINWLVTDHLGTPRMVFDKTGALATTKRHDYLPFGEELPASVGLRNGNNNTLGYTVGDSVRQKFTSKERDSETGLDYSGARYYSSGQGRFASADPLLSSGTVGDPQTWNRYSYGLNNPLRFTDPFGLYVFDKDVTEEQKKQFNSQLQQSRDNLKKIGETYGTNSNEYKKAERSLSVYGAEGVKNGVTIFASDGAGHGRTNVEGVASQKTADNPTGQSIRIQFDPAAFQLPTFGSLIGHEGSHAADGSDWVKSGFAENANPTAYQSEVDAFTAQSVLAQARNPETYSYVPLPAFKEPKNNFQYFPVQVRIWDSGWKEADRATMRAAGIDRILSRPKHAGGDYEMTSTSKERTFKKGIRF